MMTNKLATLNGRSLPERVRSLSSLGTLRVEDFALYLYAVLLLTSSALGLNGFVDIGAFLFLLGSNLLVLCANRRLLNFNILDRFVVCLVCFWVLCWTSVLWSPYPDAVLAEANLKRAIQVIVVSTLIVANSYWRKDYHTAILRILASAAITSLIVLLTIFPVSDWGTERLGGEEMGISANALGVALALGCVASIYIAKRSRFSILWYCSAVALIAGALLTGTRQALLYPALYILIQLLMDVRHVKTWVYIVLSGIALIIVYQYLVTDPFMREIIGARLEGLVNDILGVQASTEHSVEERGQFRIWALQLFLSHPLLGLGYNGFLGWLQDIGYINVTTSHCNPTEVLSSTGVVGFAIYYSLYLVCIMGLRKAQPSEKGRARQMIAFVLTLLITQFAGEVLTNITFSMYLATIYVASREFQCNNS